MLQNDVISDVHDTECKTAQSAQIWSQNVSFNFFQENVEENTHFNNAIIEIKRLTETNCMYTNAAHVIVEIIAG